MWIDHFPVLLAYAIVGPRYARMTLRDELNCRPHFFLKKCVSTARELLPKKKGRALQTGPALSTGWQTSSTISFRHR